MPTLQKSRAMVASDEAAILRVIRDRDVELTIWERSLSPELAAWLDELDLNAIGHLRFDLEPDGMWATIMERLSGAGYPVGICVNAFVDDIALLAQAFVQATGTDLIDFRLEIVTTDACRKFHADYVSVRLITTYFGQATQWVKGIPSPDTIVQQMRVGDVGLFKGRLVSETLGILHRSPPIAGTGERRLLLVLNPQRRDLPAL